MKVLKTIGICFLILGITGCDGYSLPKANPTDVKTIAISDTDAKLLITNKVNSVLTAQTSLSNQLLVYLENTVKPTSEMKESLQSSLEIVKVQTDKIKNEIETLQVSSNMKSKQENAVQLLSKLSKEIENLKENITDNDFSKLKQSQTNYKNAITSLEAVVFQ